MTCIFVFLNSDIKKNILYSGSVNSITSIVLTDNVEKYGLLIAENNWGTSFIFIPNKSANIALPYIANNSIYIDVINVSTAQNSDIQTGSVYIQQLTTNQRTFDVTFLQPFDSVPTVIAMSNGGYPQAEGGMSVLLTNRNGFKLIVENTENNTTYGYTVKYIAIAR